MLHRTAVVRIAAALACCALLLAGCSMPKLVYGQADWLLLRTIDGYLDLSDVQSERVADFLAVELERHRTAALPAFADAFRDAAGRVRRGIAPDDARWAIERGRTLVVRSIEPVLPVVASALSELDTAQRAHLAERIAERNREYRERHALDAPREVRFERRARRTVERVEDWTGPLEPEQVELVHAVRNAMPDSAPEWLEYTESRQRALLALIDTGAPAHEIEALLRGWWLRLDALPHTLAAKRDRQLEALVELAVRVDATLNSTQRMHLVDRLEDLARDADALARGT
jgi:hypothetical protein